MSDKFTINKLASSKTVKITLLGKFDESDALDFIKLYNSTLKSISTTSEYTLDFDCTKMPITPEGPLLKDCIAMYKEGNFAKILVKVSQKQTILGMQFKRLAREVGLSIELLTI